MAAVSEQSTSISNKATKLTSQSPPPPPTVLINEDIIPVPPTVPVAGISIQAHKLWIGNLDKRLTQ